MSEKGSSFLANFGQITAEGSPLWKHGLDIDLKIGDPVPSPVSGTVTAAVESGGFGNRVKILADNGKEYWLSHLDSMNVKEGDKIAMGDIVGAGGNSGSVIPMGGGDGSHLDLTVVDKDGEFITPSQIRQMFS